MPEKWIKEELKVPIDRIVISYNNSISPNLIEKILIIKHMNKGIILSIGSTSSIFNDQRTRALRDQLAMAGFKQDNNIRCFKTNPLRREDRELFIKFISIVNEYEPIDEKTYQDILHEIDIMDEELLKKLEALLPPLTNRPGI